VAQSIRNREPVDGVAVIGNYLPRQCGIATFTTDLVEALSVEAPDMECWAVVMNDTPDGYRYPPRVRFEVNQNRIADHHLAADFLNMNQVDVVCLQHEYGIFGGPVGSHVLELLRDLRMPLVTTLHTVLERPGPNQKEVIEELARLSDRLIVMSKHSVEFLRSIYRVPEEKISHIHHGIPDIPFVDPNFYKDQFGVEGRTVLLTFGLLSPGKGIEYMIRALRQVVAKYPDVVYLVLGATHPHIKRDHGEEYRLGLIRLAKELGVEKHVIFHNRFVELEELCEFLGATDIYITSYRAEAQSVSGSLAYALGAGKAVVSTPYWYAKEMLSEGRGRLVPFSDPEALAEQVIDLIGNEVEKHAMRKRAYTYCRQMIWKEVARRYLQVFAEAKAERLQHPRPVRRRQTAEKIAEQLPEIKLDHLQILTDDTGILQHANFAVPDRTHGYCTDDNARALIVAMMAQHALPEDSGLNSMVAVYLSFLHHAFNESTGRFRNFMTYDRNWTEEEGSEDSHGRALWALGMVVALAKKDWRIGCAMSLFEKALKTSLTFHSPRALAFVLLGCHGYLKRFGGDSEVRNTLKILAGRLHKRFQDQATPEWPWLEDCLTYANAKIPEALLLCGHRLKQEDMIDTALTTLHWLARIQRGSEGHFIPVGNRGWYPQGGIKARFDQQPIETQAMVEACIEAHNVTGDEKWMETARWCFDWFLGKNDLQVPLYDYTTGGCRDGLNPEGANQNQGAESTVAWLLSLLGIHSHLSERALVTPGEPTAAIAL